MGYRQAKYDEPLIIELSKEGREGFSLPEVEVEIPEEWERKELELPEVSEPQVVRHFLRLSQMAYGVDTGTYPLGSCTMKYNLKISEIVTKFPGLAYLHPYQDERTVQGALKILYELQEMTARVTGMDSVSLQPSAGAHGEFTGMLIAKAYFEDKGEERDEVIVPDSAHGTNPASAAMAGFKVIEIPSKEDGTVDLKALEAAVSEKTAALMLTNPNTLGIFESEILEISEVLHDQGALLYYDGANLNGIMGYTTPGKMGFDMVHVNFHKTFSAPHGGGGPGGGAIGVKKFLKEFLPVPIVRKEGERYYLDYSLRKTIGKVRSFYGNFLVLVKAYVYMKMAGKDLKKATEHAVLNSNYLKRRVERILEVPGKDLRKHEFVASAQKQKKERGISALDICKALLDRGLHAPTMYFPLIVREALMIEPTETESKEELDRYYEALKEILEEPPEMVRESPRNTSVRRIKDVEANKKPILTWKEIMRTFISPSHHSLFENGRGGVAWKSCGAVDPMSRVQIPAPAPPFIVHRENWKCN